MQSRRSFLAGGAALAAARKIRIGIIGTGHRAWLHMAALRASPEYEIVALADPTPEFRDRAATLAPGAAVYSDYRRMLAERRDLDAVLVAAPNFLHAEISVAALERGLHVLCEKPMATTLEDADRMMAASRRAGKVLQIGFQMRYSPVYTTLSELVRTGEIGAVQFVSANLFRGDWNPRSWKYNGTNWRYLNQTTGGTLLEVGIHELDILHRMIGSRVARVFASGGNAVFKSRETIDHAAVVIEYENGVKFEFGFALFAGNSGPEGLRMTILGSEGSLEPAPGRITVRKRDGGAMRVVTPAEVSAPVEDGATWRLWERFADSVRTGANPESARDAVKIGLLAERSIRERRIAGWNDQL